MPITRLVDWWDGLEKKAKTITVVLGAVGVIAAGPIWMFSTFATASELRTQMGGVQYQYLRNREGQIRKELFEFELKGKQKALIDIEQKRVRELQDELKEIQDDVKQLKQAK